VTTEPGAAGAPEVEGCYGDMPETRVHRELKRAACGWLWDRGYAAVGEEVVVPGVGVIDVAAAGRWKRCNRRLAVFDAAAPLDRHHVVFVECKAFRADFIRDQGFQRQFAYALAERAARLRSKRPCRPRRASQALGKFDTCLIRPHANLHYLLTPPGLLQTHELPRRWGWLVLEGGVIRVVRKPAWQELTNPGWVEGAIARSLTAARMRGACPGPLAIPETLADLSQPAAAG